MSTSPDSQLSERILKKLEENKLLLEESIAELKKDYLKGNLKSEDWILLAEKDLEKLKGKKNAK